MTGVRFLAIIGLAGALAGQQPKQAFDLNERGLAAAFHQQHAEAEELYRESIAIWRQLGPQYEPHLATTTSNLAQSLCALGQRREAEKLFQESVALFRRSMGLQDSRTLSTINLLAAVKVMLGNNDAAEALFMEILPVERQIFPHDVILGRTLEGLASVKLAETKYDEALSLAEEGLSIVTKASPEDSVETALAYANVGEIHRAAGRPARALPLYRKARAIYEKQLGPMNVRVGALLGQEGLIMLSDGKLGLAEKNLVRSLKVVTESCPDCILERIVAETNLAILRLRQKNYGEADRLFSDALAREERYYSSPGLDVAATMRALAVVKEKQHRFDDAERLQRRADLIMDYR